MSYRAAPALQAAIFGLLSAAPALAGVRILDAMPPGGGGATFVLIGPEEVLDRSDASGTGAEHRMVISVISTALGFLEAKTVAAAVSDAVLGPLPALAAGRIVRVSFTKAVARRLENNQARRIDLTFQVRIETAG